jgi:crotonobetainyl-CoA:carnitine CoA-transferase CaiB-like acyl-CoA transferase
MPNLTAGYLIGNVAPERLGNGHPNACPYGVFATRDGFIVLACGNDGQWRRLCLALGHLELAEHHDWGTNSVRIRRRREVDAAVSRWFRKWSTNDLTALLESHQVPNGPINTIGQALADPQVSALELVREVVHPTSGRLRLLGTALSMPEMDERTETPAPLLGQHRDEIISELLGLSADEIDALVRSGAFGEVAAEPGDAGLQVAQARQ